MIAAPLVCLWFMWRSEDQAKRGGKRILYIHKGLECSQSTLSKWKVIRTSIPHREMTQQLSIHEIWRRLQMSSINFSLLWILGPLRLSSPCRTNTMWPLHWPSFQIMKSQKWTSLFPSSIKKGIQQIVISLPSNKALGHDKVSCLYLRMLFHIFFQFLQLL